MTEYMVVTQTISAAGVLILAVLTYRGRARKDLREEMQRGFQSQRDEMLSGFQSLREEMQRGFQSQREEMLSGFQSQREEMLSGFASVRTEITSSREEMHEMNGRLGRVEGHLGTGVADG